VEEAAVGTDLEKTMENVDAAYQRGEITQEEAEEVARAAMERAREIPATVEKMSLSDFAVSGLVRKVASETLGETVVWAADNAEVDPETDWVVYRVAELRELVGGDTDHLRRIHVVKKHLDGELVDPSRYQTRRI